MTVNKRSKNSRQRGSHTHGWGSMKKHRGKGNRGGSGMGSSGKRSDARKPATWTDLNYFGKYGFKAKGAKKPIKTINISQIEQRLAIFLKEKKIKEEQGIYVIDLKDLGFNKLLGNGKATKKMKIQAQYASQNAVETIQKAGGQVLLPAQKK